MSAVAVREYSVAREPSAPARVGYVVAVLVNAGLLYVAENLLAWNVPYVTEDWVAVLWAVRLSLVAGLAANAMYVAYDAAWFRHLTGIGTGALALLSMVITYAVFPFDLPSAFIAEVVQLAMLAGMLGMSIAVLAQFVHLLTGCRER